MSDSIIYTRTLHDRISPFVKKGVYRGKKEGSIHFICIAPRSQEVDLTTSNFVE